MNAETMTDSPSLKYVADFRSLLPWLPQVVHWEFNELGAMSHVDPPTSPDVPEQELTLAALQVSGRLVRQFFDESPIGVAVFEPAGRLVRVNNAFGEMLGCDSESLKERNIEELIHPDDVAAHQQQRRRLFEGACEKFQMETRFASAARPEIWTRMCGRLARCAPDEPPYIFAHVVEILEPQSEHDRRRRTIEAMLLGSWEPNCYL